MVTIKAALTGVLAFTAATTVALAEPKTNLLSQWSEGSDAAAIAKLGEMFTAAGGKWEQTSIAGHTANTLAKLRADVVAGNAPPAVQLKGPEIAEWNETGMTANLDDLANKEGWDKVVAPELLPVMKPTGHWVAAPMNIHRINWIWGSTKAMEQAGIKGLPKTWAEFNADCDKAVAAHLICIAHFSQDWTDATTFEVVVYGMDEGLFKKAFVEGDTAAMRSPEMIKAFEQFRLMVSKYMDPGIAGRDYNTATAMIAKGQAVFMIMGDWQIGIFTAAGLKAGRRLPMRPGADGLGQARLHPQFGFGRLLQAEGSGLRRGAEAARPSHHVAEVPDRVQSGQGLDPRPARHRSQGLQPLPAAVAEGLAGLDRRRHAGALDGPQHDHPAEISRRDPRHRHILREQPENDRGRSRQRDGGRRRRTKVEQRNPVARRLSGGQFRARLNVAHVKRPQRESEATQAKVRRREKLGAWTPRLAIAPGVIASLVYVFGFTLWTLYISVSNSTMLPTYKFVGLKPYFDLWSNARWKIAYGNLFYFSAFYVVLSLARRSRSRHRHRSAREGRGGMADDFSLSARGLVRGHRRGVELAL